MAGTGVRPGSATSSGPGPYCSALAWPRPPSEWVRLIRDATTVLGRIVLAVDLALPSMSRKAYRLRPTGAGPNPGVRSKEEPVRTVVVSNIVSLDGFYEGPGGDVMALNMDAAFDAYNLERIRAAGTVLLGRRSFEIFSAYWPTVAGAPYDPTNRALSDDNRELSRLYDPLPKVVVSEGLVVPADNPWHTLTSVVARIDAAARVTAEKQHGSGDILVFASRTMWNSLLVQGLVDEIYLMVGPRALAGGTPAFDAPADLRLLDVRRLEASDNVLVRYAVHR